MGYLDPEEEKMRVGLGVKIREAEKALMSQLREDLFSSFNNLSPEDLIKINEDYDRRNKWYRRFPRELCYFISSRVSGIYSVLKHGQCNQCDIDEW